MANKEEIGCGKKMLKAFSRKDVIVMCGQYNAADDYIHLCGECRSKKMKQDALVSEAASTPSPCRKTAAQNESSAANVLGDEQ